MNEVDLNREREEEEEEEEKKIIYLLDVGSPLLDFNGRDFLCTEAAFFNGRVRLLVAD
jgi:hypothetical protein